MLAWPHSGFHVHDAVRVAAEDRDFAVRPAQIRQFCEMCGCQGAKLAHPYLRTLISSISTMSASSTKSTRRAASCRVQVVYVIVSQQVTPLGPYFGRTSTSSISTIRNFKSTIQHFKSVIRHFKSTIRGRESAISPFYEPVQSVDSTLRPGGSSRVSTIYRRVGSRYRRFETSNRRFEASNRRFEVCHSGM